MHRAGQREESSCSAGPGAVSANPPSSPGARTAFGVGTLSIMEGGKRLGSLQPRQSPKALAAGGHLPVALLVTGAKAVAGEGSRQRPS